MQEIYEAIRDYEYDNARDHINTCPASQFLSLRRVIRASFVWLEDEIHDRAWSFDATYSIEASALLNSLFDAKAQRYYMSHEEQRLDILNALDRLIEIDNETDELLTMIDALAVADVPTSHLTLREIREEAQKLAPVSADEAMQNRRERIIGHATANLGHNYADEDADDD